MKVRQAPVRRASDGCPLTGVLARTSLRADATDRLRAWITTGELAQGKLYTVGELAAQLGTSQTPVREALIQLANEGLVDVVRESGIPGREITDQDLDEIVSLSAAPGGASGRPSRRDGPPASMPELRQPGGETVAARSAATWRRSDG